MIEDDHHPSDEESPCGRKYRAAIERYDDHQDKCTIFTANDGAEIPASWISAQGDAFVGLDEMK